MPERKGFYSRLHSFLFLSIILFSLNPVNVFAQKENIVFEHFSVAQGMYKPIVRSVIRDRDGYLWFGTLGTIEKFDGYQFSGHKYILNNPNFTSYEWAEKLYEDRNGNIWVGTVYNGLQKFDKIKNLFTHYNLRTTGPETEWSDHVFSICEDKYGILWVGTGDGLYKFDKKSNKFICIRNNDKNPESIGSNGVGAILEDKSGSLWFGNSKGLDKLDRETGKFIHFWHDPNNKSEWSNYWVNTIFEDKSGILWLGTRMGLIAFDQKAGTFTPYIKEQWNSISSICEDESGRLWIGSWESGLYSFDQKTKKLTNYLHDNKDPGSLSSNSVTSLCFEPSGSLWIATHVGLNKLNISKKAFEHYRFGEIWSIIKGRDNKIWINTKNGLKKLDSQSGQLIQSPVNLNGSQLLYEDNK
jgi:ligand-binding sensor domain-containing protein